jgi:hypothetical protein
MDSALCATKYVSSFFTEPSVYCLQNFVITSYPFIIHHDLVQAQDKYFIYFFLFDF